MFRLILWFEMHYFVFEMHKMHDQFHGFRFYIAKKEGNISVSLFSFIALTRFDS